MSLQSRLSDLVTRIGQEIKSLNGSISNKANTVHNHDYISGQFAFSTNGVVSWEGNGGRLKWDNKGYLAPFAKASCPTGYINIYQPDTDIPALNCWDGVPRSCNANGVILNSWEGLYAVHTVGHSGSTEPVVDWYIQRYGGTCAMAHNWILVATTSGSGTNEHLKFGGSIIIPKGGVWRADTALPVGLQPTSPAIQQTGNANISGKLFVGSVGIGTTSSSNKFTVEDNSTDYVTQFIQYNSAGNGFYAWNAGNSAAGVNMLVCSDNGTNFIVKNDGKVGFGCWTPTAALTLGGGGTKAINRDTNSGNIDIYGGTDYTDGAYFKLTGNARNSGPGNSSGEFTIGTATGTYASNFAINSYSGGSWTPRFVVLGSNGNVGIGTTPGSTLHAKSGTVAELKFNSGASNLTPSLAVGNTGGTGKFAALIAGTSGALFDFDNTGYFAIGTEAKSRYTAGTLGGAFVDLFHITKDGLIGIGVSSPTAFMHIKAGVTDFPPLKFTSGPNLTTPTDGAIEYDGTNLYFTRTGTTRETVNTTVTKTDAGDGTGAEGLFQINTFDKTFKVYSNGAWRSLATW